jgi:hypothetical protein
MFPGSDSHKLIGLSHFPHLALKPGLPDVAHLGELEIISIFTIIIILIRLCACSFGHFSKELVKY